jgi:hypothetical protein
VQELESSHSVWYTRPPMDRLSNTDILQTQEGQAAFKLVQIAGGYLQYLQSDRVDHEKAEPMREAATLLRDISGLVRQSDIDPEVVTQIRTHHLEAAFSQYHADEEVRGRLDHKDMRLLSVTALAIVDRDLLERMNELHIKASGLLSGLTDK